MRYPIKSLCESCGIQKWRECYQKAMACDALWKWLADRGDFRMALANMKRDEEMRQKLIANRPFLEPPNPRQSKRRNSLR